MANQNNVHTRKGKNEIKKNKESTLKKKFKVVT
jgi:hypothetical protein